MIGEIYKITHSRHDPDLVHQLKFGYSALAEGTPVLLTTDIGGGLFYALSYRGNIIVSEDYLVLCQASLESVI